MDTESVITSYTEDLSSPSSIPSGKSVDELLQVPSLSSFNYTIKANRIAEPSARRNCIV